MKFNKYWYSLLLLFTAANSVAQSHEFAYRRKIENITANDWYTVALPADIFKNCERDFRDLRILELTNGDTIEVPYLLDILQTEIDQHEVVLSSVNQSSRDNEIFVTFLNTGFKVNHLDLSFVEENFFATVKVEGSNDRKQWFVLTKNEKVFSVENSNERYSSSTVNFPLTDYNYLRLTIASADKVTLSRAAFRMDEIKLGSFEEIPATFTVSTDKKSKRTVIDVPLDHFRPVSNIALEIAEQHDFYRHIIIETLVDSIHAERGWIRNYQMVSGNLITSFKPNQFSIPLTLTNRLRITIENYDNTPLPISAVKLNGARIQLRAKLRTNESCLFYCKDRHTKTQYENQHFADKIPMQTAQRLLGPEESIAPTPTVINAIFENKAWLWGILVAIIALLGFFTLKMMKTKPA